MKIHIKRNELNYNGEKYSVEVPMKVEGTCDCIDQVNYTIKNNEYLDSFDCHNVKVFAYLIAKYMETDIDYDWEENPIYTDYEAENYIPINYCPICGDKIEIIVDEVVDLSDIIAPLIEELKPLEIKQPSVANYKRRNEIENKIRKLMFT